MLNIESGLAAYLAEVGKLVGPPQPGSALDWTFRRAQLEKIASALSPPRPIGITVEDMVILRPDRAIAIRLYHPVSSLPLPLLIFFHGGGWVFGSVATHDYLAAILAKAIDCVVLSVDYRRAPEHGFPAILDDCYEALEWASRNPLELRVDPTKIGLSGDSAGAHLAACCAMRAKGRGLQALKLQLLLYPMIEPAFERASYTQFAEAPGLTRAEAIAFWNAAFGDPLPKIEDFASPGRADPQTFPPTYVLTAEFDPLRDEGEDFGQRLAAAGRPTIVRRAERMMHGFMRAIPFSQPAREELERVCEWARTGFGT